MASKISQWNFEGPTAAESIATNNDVLDSWGSNNGTITLAHEPVVKIVPNCISGKCLSFGGSAYIEVTDNPNLNMQTDLTISVWFKANSSVSKTLLSKNNVVAGAGQPSYTIDLGTNGLRFLDTTLC
ncbi:MAG: hypothetical protein PHG23_02210 [Candidatus Pacebacteria bacterium]|nr:hypothetical protein [Candidatus Paceibacterota bacterium]